MTPNLKDLVAAELAEPVDPRVASMAGAIAGAYPGAAQAVLFYGSCLRTSDLDGLMLDFYLIVSDYRAAYGKSWLAVANRLIPPNVFPFEHGGLTAKYAVLSEADFRREIGVRARSVSIWARFAQPSRLAWSRDRGASDRMADMISDAAPTLLRHTLPIAAPQGEVEILDVWKKGFSLTYGAELRAERNNRSATVVDSDPERYERFGLAALGAIAGEKPLAASRDAMRRRWRAMQRKGKMLSVLRLAKASGTFAGGIDYIAWKINRHAGTDIAIKPWQRRWPLLGAVTLLPLLLKKGAIR